MGRSILGYSAVKEQSRRGSERHRHLKNATKGTSKQMAIMCKAGELKAAEGMTQLRSPEVYGLSKR
jgi:hypothetical protein